MRMSMTHVVSGGRGRRGAEPDSETTGDQGAVTKMWDRSWHSTWQYGSVAMEILVCLRGFSFLFYFL